MNRGEFNRKIIGENLRKLRLAKGLTVEDVRCYLKLGSVQAIYKYENGVSYPQVDTFLSLLELYGATWQEVAYDQKGRGLGHRQKRFEKRPIITFELQTPTNAELLQSLQEKLQQRLCKDAGNTP